MGGIRANFDAASGFMSNMSRWLGPPEDEEDDRPGAAGWRGPRRRLKQARQRHAANNDSPPTRSSSRREMPSHNRPPLQERHSLTPVQAIIGHRRFCTSTGRFFCNHHALWMRSPLVPWDYPHRIGCRSSLWPDVNGDLCDVSGQDVEAITDSDLYCTYVLGEVSPLALPTMRERHIRCHPATASTSSIPPSAAGAL